MAFLLGRSTRGGGGHCFCLICGGRWQIPQDWAKTARPNFCVAVNWSSVPACCAGAPAAASAPKRMAERTAKRTAERIAALRFILDPPDIAFFARLRPRGAERKARGGVTGMRSCGRPAPCGRDFRIADKYLEGRLVGAPALEPETR